VVIDTPRLRLRCWREADREPFAAVNADPEVMRYLSGPLSREASDARIDTYMACFHSRGFCRWALETRDGVFLGCAGVMAWPEDHEPLGAHVEVGWRLARTAWGKGYATEATRAALDDVFARVGLREILACTERGNLRSRAVMARLGLQRDPSRDFSYANAQGVWEGLVWIARPQV
jgi:RimJ/RimL family protein N-acetyltransferase